MMPGGSFFHSGYIMHSILSAALLILAPQASPVRAVVQEGRPQVIAIDANETETAARVALCTEGGRGYRATNLVQCVDVANGRIRFTTEAPQRIMQGAIAPSGEWAVVCGETDTYRIDMNTGEISVMIRGLVGHVAISDDDSQIAIGISQRLSGGFDREDLSNLRIYDVAAKKWSAKTATGIAIMNDVVFSGDEVLAVGLGGRVFSRARRAYFAAAKFNWKTGELSVEKSETPFVHQVDPERLTPPEIKLLQKQREATQHAIGEFDHLDASGHNLGRTRTFALHEREDGVHVVLNRWAGGANGGYWAGLHLVLNESGEIAYETFDDAMDLVEMRGDMVAQRYGETAYQCTNLFTDATFEVPRREGKVHYGVTESGLLIDNEETLRMLVPESDAVVWEQPAATGFSRSYYAASGDGKLVAISAMDSDTIEIRRATDGKVIANVKRESAIPKSYIRAMAFSPDSATMAVLENTLRIYRSDTWEKTTEEILPDKSYIQHVCHVGGEWLLGGASESVLFNPMTGWGTRFDVSEAHRATPVEVGGKKCLLLETRGGRAVVADAESGEIKAEWINKEYYSSSIVHLPPALLVVFGGKAIIRQMGNSGRFTIQRTSDLQTVATFVPIPLKRGVIGWVMTTPDGRWAASKEVRDAGIEKRLVLYREGEPLDSAEVAKFEVKDARAILRDSDLLK